MSTDTLGQPILSVQGVSRAYGAQPVLGNVSLTVHEGDRIGLVGRNGTGKTTLLKIMAGIESPDAGMVTRRQGLQVAILGQQCLLDRSNTVAAVLEDVARKVDEAETKSGYAARFTGVGDSDQRIKRLRVALGLPDGDRLLGSLSGGELRRVDIAATLLQRPDLLLLDEPTNHIDVQSIQWIEDFLTEYAGSCVLVTHDRYFLDRVASRMVEIEDAQLFIHEGNYEAFLAAKALRDTHAALAETNRQAALRRELAWLRRGAKARSTKQRARIGRYHALESMGPLTRAKGIRAFQIPQPKRLGKRILEVDGVSRSRGSGVLFRALSLIVQADMRVGIVGPNGCGKTSLLRVLMGIDLPDAGAVRQGDTTEFLYVDQTHEEIDPESTILEHVSHGARTIEVGGNSVFVPGYLEPFLFDRSSLEMPMRNLSGGERNRLDLAKKLLRGGNVLVLDEPTNDLDLVTLRLLEETVESFDGPALIVSHDRYFLNRLCTDLLVFEGEGRVAHIRGNYDDYVLRRERLAAQSEKKAPAAGRVSRQAPSADASDRKTRLTWSERKELEGIEQEIAITEAELRQIEAHVHDPAFYQQDYASVRQTLALMDAAKDRVERLYERWAELDAMSRNC